MKKQRTVYWRIGQAVTLTALVFVLGALPGQHGRLAQARQGARLIFVENVGQFPVLAEGEEIRFQVRSDQSILHLTDNALWFTLLKRSPADALTHPDAAHTDAQPADKSHRGINLKLSFAGANPQPRLEPFNRLNDTHVSYFAGSDPANWRTDVPAWGGVRYTNLYPGIDLEITSENGQLMQRLIVRDGDIAVAANADSPGEAGNLATLQNVRWRVEGADGLALEDGGRLRLTTAVGDFTLPLLQIVTADGLPLYLPTAQATVNGDSITAPFATLPQARIDDRGAGNLAAADTSDLLYSTFLGGSGSEQGWAIAVDGTGSAYVTGTTSSTDFPTTPGAFDTSYGGGDVFVAKLNATGTGLTYATFLGGGRGFAITVNGTGNAYVTGDASSADFPTTPGAFDTSFDGGDAFVVKLNATGTELAYATFLGGGSSEQGQAIALDGAGNAYVTGFTASTDFPTTPGAFDTSYQGGGYFGHDAFVAKLNAAGSELTYATFLGGSDTDQGYAIAVDGTGSAYVTGQTESADFPTTAGAFDTGHKDIFIAKLNSAGSGLAYATFLGGSGNDSSQAIAVDRAGNAYVAGDTTSANFPTTPGAFETDYHSSGDITHEGDTFVVKLNPAGSGLAYATFLGGSDHDNGFALAVDGTGSAYVTGSTYSTDFPTTPGVFQPDRAGYPDAFAVKLNPAGSGLHYATFLGGNHGEAGYAIAVDEASNAYVAGYTSSSDFPTSVGAFDTSLDGGQDTFVTKLKMESGPEPTPTPIPPHTCAPAPLGTIRVGNTPRGIAVDSTRHRVYVANYGSSSVSVIDSATNTVIETIPNVTSANGVAYDPKHNVMWVTNYDNDQVTPIQADADATSFTVLPPVTVGDGPWGVAYDLVYDYVYVVNHVGNSVTVVDVSSAGPAVVATLSGSFDQPFHVTASPVTGRAYITNFGNHSVTVVNGASVSQVVDLYDSHQPYGIAMDEGRNLIYVATVEPHRVVVIGSAGGVEDQFLGWAAFHRGFGDPRRPVPLRTIAVNPNIGPAGDGGHLWTTTSTADGSEVNQALLIPKGWGGYFHFPLPQDVEDNPAEGMAVDRISNRVYAASGGAPGTITVLGDHTSLCAVAPAGSESLQDDVNQIGFEIFSRATLANGDVNGDSQVDIFDLAFIASHYGGNEPTADVNGDGTVDIFDLAIAASNYNW